MKCDYFGCEDEATVIIRGPLWDSVTCYAHMHLYDGQVEDY